VANNGPNIELQASSAPAVRLPKWIVPAGFVCGCAFLVAVLGVVVLVPTLTPAQEKTVRTVLALAGAGYSMSLTGVLSIRLNLPQKELIVAGGTLAVFIVLFFFSPTISAAPGSEPAPEPRVNTTVTGNQNTVISGNKGPVHVEQGISR
jgi:hypothetical protein